MGAQLSQALAGLVCQAILGSLVGAVILRAACAWYNSMVGRSRGGRFQPQQTPGSFAAPGENPYAAPATYSQMPVNTDVGVPEPGFGQACLIAFVTIIVNGIVGFVIGLAIGAGGAAVGAKGPGPTLVGLAVSIPVSFLVFAGMLTAMLPTTFGRAAIVTLLYFVVTLLVVLVLVGIAFGLMFMAGMNR